MSEATSPDADPAKDGGYRYEANKRPRIDYAAKALAEGQAAHYKKYPDAPRSGHLWYVTRVDN